MKKEVLILLLIVVICIALMQNTNCTKDLMYILIAGVGVYFLLSCKSQSKKEGFLDIPYNHGVDRIMSDLIDDEISDVDLPNDLQDLYVYENTIAAQKVRNKDAYPEEFDKWGPRLRPQWPVDNSDVVNSVMEYSRGVYGYDPLYPGRDYVDQTLGPYKAYNTNAIDNDFRMMKYGEWANKRDKFAIDKAVRGTRNLYDKYFVRELDEGAHRYGWWDHATDPDSDMNNGY